MDLVTLENREIHPDTQARVGKRPHLAQLSTQNPRPAILHPLLQPPTPHSALADRPPISRVHNLRGQHLVRERLR
jgi:hypothetical protein